MVSRALWLSLSGNLTSYSTMRSPRRSGRLGYGSPSPEMRRFIPGCTMSVMVTVTVLPSRVGACTTQPHRAWWEQMEDRRRLNVSKERVEGVFHFGISDFIGSDNDLHL